LIGQSTREQIPISFEDKIRIDGRELESAGWITRDQIRRQTQDGNLLLPSVKSIARDLIDDWLNEVTVLQEVGKLR